MAQELRPQTEPRLEHMWHGLQEHLATRLIIIGVLITLLGCVALASTLVTGLTLTILMGTLLIASGVIELADALTNRVPGRSLRTALSGALAVLAGIYLIARPTLGLAGLTLVIGMFFFATGAFRFFVALLERYEQWAWSVAYGLLSFALGLIAVWSWPTTSQWLLGTLVGCELIFRGVMLVSMGFVLRPSRGSDRPHAA